MKSEPPDAISDLCAAFKDGLLALLGEKLFAIILHGASAFPDSLPSGDVDFHVILTAIPDEEERRAIDTLHKDLAVTFPPLGAEIDCYYLLLEDARQPAPPRSVMWSGVVDGNWALHRAHFLAGRCIVLYGQDPQTFMPQPTWQELEAALLDELAYIARNLERYPAYCVLNLCRVIYSFGTRNVVISKAAAAMWAYETWPEWRAIIDAARHAYAGHVNLEEQKLLVSKTSDFYAFARSMIFAEIQGDRH